MINIVLLEPEIPQNTGNIARTCAATGCRLHLIEPMGFSVDEKQVKRAGLDYWHLVDLTVYTSLEDFYEKNPGEYYYLSTKAEKTYDQIAYPMGCYLIFGKETKGLPELLLQKNRSRCVRIPMRAEARSLNLSNSVAIVAYEAIRQHGFDSMKMQGDLFLNS